jgi:large subunit ribosomal protein L7/L12
MEEKKEEKVEKVEKVEIKEDEKEEKVEKVETKEDKKEEKKEEKVSAKLEEIIKKVEELSVMELADLVKALEDKFGVSATPQMMASAGAAGGAEGEADEEKKDSVSVILQDAGQSKIQIIKEIKEIMGLGLKESKDLVDAAPKALKENIPVSEAEEIKKKLEESGATVEIK